MASSQRHSLVLSLAAAVAVVLVVWFATTDSAAESSASSSAVESPTAVSDESTDLRVDAVGVDDARQPIEVARREAEPTRLPQRRVILRGQISSLSGPVTNAELRVAAGPHDKGPLPPQYTPEGGGRHREVLVRRIDGSKPRRSYVFSEAASTDAVGRYTVDVSRFFPDEADDHDRASDPEAINVLWVSVASNAAPPAEFDVLLLRRGALAPRSFLVEFTADLWISDSTDATGSVRLEDESTTNVAVAAFLMVDGRPAETPFARQTGRGGLREFLLRLESDEEYAFVACAQGFRPHTVLLARGVPRDLGEIVLTRGLSIRGDAIVAGAPVYGHLRIELAAPQSRELVPRCTSGGEWLAWIDGRFEWDASTAKTEPTGAFVAQGLGAFDYRIALRSSYGVYSSTSRAFDVRAPASGVRLRPALCRVELHVFRDGEPAPRRTIEVSEFDGSGTVHGACVTDAFGAVVLWVDPDRETTVGFRPPGDSSVDSANVRRIDCRGIGGAAVTRRIDF